MNIQISDVASCLCPLLRRSVSIFMFIIFCATDWYSVHVKHFTHKLQMKKPDRDGLIFETGTGI
jgi:hypothetical protein